MLLLNYPSYKASTETNWVPDPQQTVFDTYWAVSGCISPGTSLPSVKSCSKVQGEREPGPRWAGWWSGRELHPGSHELAPQFLQQPQPWLPHGPPARRLVAARLINHCIPWDWRKGWKGSYYLKSLISQKKNKANLKVIFVQQSCSSSYITAESVCWHGNARVLTGETISFALAALARACPAPFFQILR